jgi:hypothetical protein
LNAPGIRLYTSYCFVDDNDLSFRLIFLSETRYVSTGWLFVPE